MKSFKSYIAEVAEPKPEEEKRFKDQHEVEVIDHPVAEPHQHSGDIQKPRQKRRADQEGDDAYDQAYVMKMEEVDLEETTLSATKKPVNVTGPDGKVRTVMKRTKAVRHDEKGQDVIKTKSEELSPKQKKIDHNKNGKIDGHDLAMLRAKKKNEELELSKESVEEAFGNWQVKTNKITKTYKARHAGEALRKAKKSGHFGNIALDAKHVSKVNESEELAELKKSTYGSYIKKATQDVVDAQREITSGGTKHKDYPEYRDLRNKRKKGIAKAVDRLTKEGVELEEKFKHPAAAELMDYANKLRQGDIDKGYLQKAAGHIEKHKQSGMASDLVKHIKAGDTDPRDKVMNVLQKHDSALHRSVAKKAGLSENWATKAMMGKSPVKKKYKAPTEDEKRRDRAKDMQKKQYGAMMGGLRKGWNEEVESIQESVKWKAGPVRLKDGSQIVVDRKDAKLLNDMFKDLSSRNQKEFYDIAMMDKAGYEEIVGFAREAL